MKSGTLDGFDFQIAGKERKDDELGEISRSADFHRWTESIAHTESCDMTLRSIAEMASLQYV